MAEPLPDDGRVRCGWADGSAAERVYHDTEWGVPLRGDRALFEFLVLEGAQAGLSWRTILERRDHYRRVFHGFDIERVAAMDEAGLAACLRDPGIVRNRLKVLAARDNARAALALIAVEGSLSDYLWSFVDGRPIDNRNRHRDDVAARTQRSGAMSADLRRRGFRFVGPTICHAFMQATGMLNDHLLDCFRHAECRLAGSCA